ncbi:polyketide cyclase [Microbacterium oleivorans]|uniref:polyketide cyclase n=1 Tax=Microbacterium oleivorans TaxID=273677 RepID=UPI00080E9AE6|nr:polyketide cyclase [Microbacterium oleivorans]
MTWPVLHLTRTIESPPREVIAFAGDPANLPRWAAGLSSGIRNEGGHWLADSPLGDIEVAFVGPVEAGVLDHEVTLPDGTVVHNPLRVLRNDAGSEVVFTLFRRRGVTDAEFADDAAAIEADLEMLRTILDR